MTGGSASSDETTVEYGVLVGDGHSRENEGRASHSTLERQEISASLNEYLSGLFVSTVRCQRWQDSMAQVGIYSLGNMHQHGLSRLVNIVYSP